MGNLCTGETKETLIQIQEEAQPAENDQELDDLIYDAIEEPRPDIAYNIQKLPDDERDEKNLAKLQERIKLMQANEKKGKKIKKIKRQHPEGKKLPDPYNIRSINCIYIGEWVYSGLFNSSIPGGLGRLYKEDEIMEGQFRTFFDENDIKQVSINQNLSQALILENMKRAKFFGIDTKREIAASSKEKQNIKVLLDGEGRIFSRIKELNGFFKAGILHGKGQMIIREEKDVYQYQGEFNEGKKQGKGLEKYRGNEYQGDFKNDQKCGKGILTLFISHKFQEEQNKQALAIEQDNKQRDSSKLNAFIQDFIEYRKKNFDKIFRDALKDLPWKGPEGQLKGKRFLDDSDFQLQHFRRNKFTQYYKGQFKNNLFDGEGKYVWFNGKTYEGSWKAGKMHGYGQFFWHNGGLFYEGQYQNDLKHGKGVMFWGMTKRYRGSWAFGLRHGYGQLITIQSTLEKVDQKKYNPNLLTETSRIIVIGALFNKDKIAHQYFKKVIQPVDIKIQLFGIKFKRVNAKVIGVRCDLIDPEIKDGQEELQQQK